MRFSFIPSLHHREPETGHRIFSVANAPDVLFCPPTEWWPTTTGGHAALQALMGHNAGVTRLLDDKALVSSSVVANCTMNRERSLSGSNGYGRELGIDVMAELSTRATAATPVRWLDLCCGTGRAPAEAAGLLADRGLTAQAQITGLDLVDHFVSGSFPPLLRLISGSVSQWIPDGRFDLITCVHGLHYVGDKLGGLSRIASWLTSDGLFVDAGLARTRAPPTGPEDLPLLAAGPGGPLRMSSSPSVEVTVH